MITHSVFLSSVPKPFFWRSAFHRRSVEPSVPGNRHAQTKHWPKVRNLYTFQGNECGELIETYPISAYTFYFLLVHSGRKEGLTSLTQMVPRKTDG